MPLSVGGDVDDMLDLINAAAKLKDDGLLKKMEERLGSSKLAKADKGRGYHELAGVYKAGGNTAQEEKSLDKVLELGEHGKEEWRSAASQLTKLRPDAGQGRQGQKPMGPGLCQEPDLPALRAAFEAGRSLERRRAIQRGRGGSEVRRLREVPKEGGVPIYAVYVNAIQKPMTAFHVPTVIEKLKFARSPVFPENEERRAATIEDGAQACVLAETELERSKEKKWKVYQCECMVQLGWVRLLPIAEELVGKEPAAYNAVIKKHKKDLAEITTLWLAAKKLGAPYSERWEGELSYETGYWLVRIENYEQATIEFKDSLAKLSQTKKAFTDTMKNAQKIMKEYLAQ